MSGALTLQPNVSLAQIQSSATSVRIHAVAPTTYAGAVSTALGIASFAAGSLFSLSGMTLSAGMISGSVLGAGQAAWLSISDDGTSTLLATGPLPFSTTIAATENNWLLSLSLTVTIGAPTLTV